MRKLLLVFAIAMGVQSELIAENSCFEETEFVSLGLDYTPNENLIEGQWDRLKNKLQNISFVFQQQNKLARYIDINCKYPEFLESFQGSTICDYSKKIKKYQALYKKALCYADNSDGSQWIIDDVLSGTVSFPLFKDIQPDLGHLLYLHKALSEDFPVIRSWLVGGKNHSIQRNSNNPKNTATVQMLAVESFFSSYTHQAGAIQAAKLYVEGVINRPGLWQGDSSESQRQKIASLHRVIAMTSGFEKVLENLQPAREFVSKVQCNQQQEYYDSDKESVASALCYLRERLDTFYVHTFSLRNNTGVDVQLVSSLLLMKDLMQAMKSIKSVIVKDKEAGEWTESKYVDQLEREFENLLDKLSNINIRGYL